MSRIKKRWVPCRFQASLWWGPPWAWRRSLSRPSWACRPGERRRRLSTAAARRRSAGWCRCGGRARRKCRSPRESEENRFFYEMLKLIWSCRLLVPDGFNQLLRDDEIRTQGLWLRSKNAIHCAMSGKDWRPGWQLCSAPLKAVAFISSYLY